MNNPDINLPASQGISRRRVMVGAAWATPAILIATGSSPAAASGTASVSTMTWGIPGTLAFNGSYFTNINGANSELNLKAFHSGPYNAEDFASVTMTVVVPADKVETALMAGSGGTGWTVGAPTVTGSTVIYVATYTGAAVGKYQTTTTLVLRWKAKGAAPYPLTASVSGEAMSGGRRVTAAETFTRAK